jgi:predicted small lipoprotein YifL
MVVRGPSALARAWQSLYGAARIGDFVVIKSYRPSSSGWAIIVLSVTALALGGCGRKGGLDLPPNAPQVSSAPDTEAERAAQPSVFNPTYGSEAGPSAPKGGRKKFVLDPLLD